MNTSMAEMTRSNIAIKTTKNLFKDNKFYRIFVILFKEAIPYFAFSIPKFLISISKFLLNAIYYICFKIPSLTWYLPLRLAASYWPIYRKLLGGTWYLRRLGHSSHTEWRRDDGGSYHMVSTEEYPLNIKPFL